MSFPIQFVKSSGDNDYVSPVINFTGNVAIVGGISYLAWRTLGFAYEGSSEVKAIPANRPDGGGLESVLLGGGALLYMLTSVYDALHR